MEATENKPTKVQGSILACSKGCDSGSGGQFAVVSAKKSGELPKLYPIFDLDDKRFRIRDPMRNPVLAYISTEDEEYKVEIPEIEAYAYSSSLEDALVELVADVVQLCEEILAKHDADLGSAPRLWKQYLSRFIKTGG